ncbi:hypothetical protein [Nocardioides ferulae]|uniref:hypothetical protein n=1 Tax=Nocardioides ferulae TaxID=2340821 RepID=UPI000EB28086|nr:hypothetical protein [Nocardioides ferulae]
MKKLRFAVAAIGTAALLAGCGSDDGDSAEGDDGFADRPADEIVETAKSAMQDLSSVHVAGEVSTDGTVIGMDIRLSDEGECSGTMDVGAEGVVEVVSTGGESWFRADEAFWTTAGIPADQQALVLDKWVVDSEGDFAEFCDLDELIGDLFDNDDESAEKFTVKGTEELDGEEVVVIEQDDEEEGVSTGYVQAGGEHYMVKIEKTEGEDTGSVTFTEFGEDVEVEAPAEDEVVDLNTLG